MVTNSDVVTRYAFVSFKFCIKYKIFTSLVLKLTS